MLLIELIERCADHQPGAVYERVDPAEARERSLDERAAARAVPKVLVRRFGLAAGTANLGRDCVRDRSIRTQAVDTDAGVVDHDGRAALRQQQGVRTPEAPSRAGHEDDLAGEVDHGARR